jgi:hypothetical protein
MRRSSLPEVLEELVSENRLAPEDSKRILKAPRFSFDVRELLYYLAALIVTVGVVRLVVVIFSDASTMAVIAALYLAAFVFAALAWRLQRVQGWVARLGEVTELLAVLSCAIATGVLLREQLELSGEVAAIIPAAASAVWGVIRLRTSQFSATAVLIPSLLVTGGSAAALLDWEGPPGALPVMVAASVLVFIGSLDLQWPLAFRVVGAYTLLITAPQWVGERGSVGGLAVTLSIGVALFVLGSLNMWIELLVAGGLTITIGISVFVFKNVDNEVLQGILVVAIGLLIVTTTVLVYRHQLKMQPAQMTKA